MSRFMVFASLLVTVLAFQNCQNTNQFSSSSGLLEKSGGVITATDITEEDVLAEDDDRVSEDEELAENDDDDSSADDNDSSVGKKDDKDCDNKGEDKPKNLASDDDESESEDEEGDDSKAAKRYMCKVVLAQGNGKIALADEAIVTEKRRPGVICMSKSACETIVSQVFTVKKAIATGYCRPEKALRQGDKVHHLSDAEVQAKINELK